MLTQIVVDHASLAAMRLSLDGDLPRVPQALRHEALARALGYETMLGLRTAAWMRPLRFVDAAAFVTGLGRDGWVCDRRTLIDAIAAGAAASIGEPRAIGQSLKGPTTARTATG